MNVEELYHENWTVNMNFGMVAYDDDPWWWQWGVMCIIDTAAAAVQVGELVTPIPMLTSPMQTSDASPSRWTSDAQSASFTGRSNLRSQTIGWDVPQ